MEIGTLWFVVALVVILLELWAIWHIIGSDRRAERKMLWVVFVVYAPFPGLLIWAWRGPRAVKGRCCTKNRGVGYSKGARSAVV
ncbi:PLD nuclease N-terminal domain-containing protein [Pseudomonas mosselii]|uniref:PLD nuclease N-terminal domain-containing protein n=1 Tax=Pseudomonas mosselii TaxID=78327 RepID=A0AA42RSG2_9PSED|nr:PLD nuclease N-terminal domain-containing protein [Pseudomonas mosselii]MDH1629244.1 PLD nuclease N-terminal domain-containing protein [Pseudomonas mosselii]